MEVLCARRVAGVLLMPQVAQSLTIDDLYDNAKLFIGQIPKTMNHEELRTLFTPFGEIVEVKILTDRPSGLHRGCGFVTFRTKAQAFQAIDALNDKHVVDTVSIGTSHIRYTM
jgi:CUG-BP- and ETR3-like factor